MAGRNPLPFRFRGERSERKGRMSSVLESLPEHSRSFRIRSLFRRRKGKFSDCRIKGAVRPSEQGVHVPFPYPAFPYVGKGGRSERFSKKKGPYKGAFCVSEETIASLVPPPTFLMYQSSPSCQCSGGGGHGPPFGARLSPPSRPPGFGRLRVASVGIVTRPGNSV